MSHWTMYFLVSAENLEMAKQHVNNYLENENSFYDGYEVIDNECGTLAEKRLIFDSTIAEHDYLAKAEKFVTEAKEQVEKNWYGMAGDYYRRAGLLYDQGLSDDMPYFNITDCSYETPHDPKGWFYIPVDFHY
ncbi:hypothetical protein FACS1894110_01920 [Spirochaetia bacterium]|nr:hypothetical protein FACS1894110_01920 [Spirochaetia bacterium]